MSNQTIALFAPHFEFSGATTTMHVLAREFAQSGYRVHLLRAHREWSAPEAAAAGVTMIDLASTALAPIVERPRTFRGKMILLALATVPPLIAYLRRYRPRAIVMALLTVPGVLAVKLSGVRTRSIVSIQGLPRPGRLHHPLIQRHSYRMADAIVAENAAIVDTLAQVSGINRSQVQVIYPPHLDEAKIAQIHEPVEHPWFLEHDLPVVLGVGRLIAQKDFETLLHAFALVRAQRPARLVIVGEGGARTELEQLAAQLGVQEDVSLPGWATNPMSLLAQADVFVMSSLWEGSPRILIEAMAAGAPIVSTDCPAGPRELLLQGQAGTLVPTANPEAMAGAILATLASPEAAREKARAGLRQLGRFQTTSVVKQYLHVIEAG